MTWRDGLPPEDDSFDFIGEVMAMVNAIPEGRVMTYGDIAYTLSLRNAQAGGAERFGPRMVGFVMSHFGGDLPWWRVVRAGGHPPRFHHDQALPHYQDEGTPLLPGGEAYRIDMKRARFDPDGEDAA